MMEIDPAEAYRQAGVDLDISNIASQIAHDICSSTWTNREVGEYGRPDDTDGQFTSLKSLDLSEIRRRPNIRITHEVDGTGTKPELYERMENFRGLGRDLIAMVADDAPINGGQIVVVDNILMISRITNAGLTHFHELFQGLAEGADIVGASLFTGETAFHGNRLNGPTDLTVDWGGFGEGFILEERAITGEKVKEGDELWAFEEPEGFRCNGISRVRKTFEEYYGPEWHKAQFQVPGGVTIGEAAAAPSTIYSGLMTSLTGGYKKEIEPLVDVHGAAHISGGSIPEKVGRMLRLSGLGADITDLFDLPSIMRHAQMLTEVDTPSGRRHMSDEEMISTWHGGQGYVIAIDGEDGDMVSKTAQEHGIHAKSIGHISKRRGIRITSNGARREGKVMEFAA